MSAAPPLEVEKNVVAPGWVESQLQRFVAASGLTQEFWLLDPPTKRGGGCNLQKLTICYICLFLAFLYGVFWSEVQMVSWLGFSWRIFVISKWLIKWASTVPTRKMQDRAEMKNTQVSFAGWPSWCDTKKPQWHVPDDTNYLTPQKPTLLAVADKPFHAWRRHLKAWPTPPEAECWHQKSLCIYMCLIFGGRGADFKWLLLIIFMIVSSWLFLKICTSTNRHLKIGEAMSTICWHLGFNSRPTSWNTSQDDGTLK